MNQLSTRLRPPLEYSWQAFARLDLGRRLAVGAALFGLFVSFLPWYGATGAEGAAQWSVSVSGWRDWGLLAILFMIVGGEVAALPMTGTTLHSLVPSLPRAVTEARLIRGAGILAVLAILLFMLREGNDIHNASTGPTMDAYLGLLCALAIAAGGHRAQRASDER